MIDDRMPSFHEAWDGDCVGGILADIAAPGWAVERVELDKIRHRIGSRGIVQHRVVLRGTDGRVEHSVAGVCHADRDAGGRYRKLGRERLPVVKGLTTPIVHDAHLNMLFMVFPVDRRLPGLSSLNREPVLGIDARSHQLVRHRLGLGATLQSGDRFLKFHPQGHAGVVRSRSTALHRAVAGRVALALPTMFDVSRDVTATLGAAGRPLPDVASMSTVAAVVDSLTLLHRCVASGMPLIDDVPLRRAERAAAWLGFVAPHHVRPMTRLLAIGAARGGADALVHGDMKPEHAFVAGSGVQFIDLDSAGFGRSASDIASLAVRLDDLDLGVFTVEHWARSARTPAAIESELALATLKLALFHGQHRRPGWDEAIDDLFHRRHPTLAAAANPLRV